VTSQSARALRQRMTDAERLLWRHLRNRELGGWKFRRQYPVGSFIVDFICLEKNVVIEVDGGQHAENEVDSAKFVILPEFMVPKQEGAA
jgi:very-short-patch-repair endonuclease